MIQGPSRDADAAVRAAVERALADEAGGDRLSGDLFAVAELLGREPALRRALADPGRTAEDRVGMAEGLLRGQVSDGAISVIGAAVAQRWSLPSHLGNALQDAAVQATVDGAVRAGELDRVEDELFRFRRILGGAPDLRTTLADGAIPVDRRVELVESLLGDRVAPATRTLVAYAIRDQRARSLDHALDHLSGVVAATRNQLVAHVRAAVELDEAQRQRLAAALASIYGREVALNVEVDPTVLGGASVRIGDEVVDATVAARLDEARRRLAG